MKLLDFINQKKIGSLCTICSTSINSENASPSACEHAFHLPCLEKYVESHKTNSQSICPIESCRRDFTAISVRKTIGGIVYKNISLAIDTQCPICCEDIQPPIATPESCNHHFCYSCLNEWAKIRHECPLDRGPFELILLSDKFGGPITERRFAPPAYVPPPEPEDNTECEICHSMNDEESLLLCDNCDKGYHTYCLNPPIEEIPEGDWFCPQCSEQTSSEDEEEEEEVVATSSRVTRSHQACRSSTRLRRFADRSAEEVNTDEEEAEEDENEGSYRNMHYLSPTTQRRLGQIAERRHRGTGLLLDLIEQLRNRAEQEQSTRTQRRRGRQQRAQRRRVIVNETQISPTTATEASEPITHSPIQVTTTRPLSLLGSLRPNRKRRLCISDSDDSEESSSTQPPQTRQHLNHANGSECSSLHTPSTAATNRDAVGAAPTTSSPIRNSNELLQTSVSSTASTVSQGQPSTSHQQPPNTSRQDLFSSFASDSIIAGIVDDIHSIASKCRPSSTKSTKTLRKRAKRSSRKARQKTGSSRKARQKTGSSRRLMSRARNSFKKNKFSSAQKHIKRIIINNKSPVTTSSATASSSGHWSRSKDMRRATPTLSILGGDLNCGLLSDPDDEKPSNAHVKQPESIPKGPSTSLLGRLEAEQSSLFQFGSGHMQINADNSVSPKKLILTPASSSHKPFMTPTYPRPSSFSAVLKQSNNVASSSTDHFLLHPPCASSRKETSSSLMRSTNGRWPLTASKSDDMSLFTPSSSSVSSSNGPSSTTWSSVEASNISEMLRKYLDGNYRSTIDKETGQKIAQRALSKIIAKPKSQVKEQKMKKLVDDYVTFYQRNALL